MNIADLELNESQLDVEKHIESTIAIGGHIFETQHRRKDGTVIDLEVSLQHFRNSDQVVAFFRDITERKRYTKALFESEKKFKLLYDKAPLSYQSLDKNACLLDVNETWLVTLGYSRNEVVGKPFANFMTPESAKLIEPRFKAFVENGEIHNHEFDMVKKDGSIIHVTYDGNIGYDDAGFFVQTHCIFQDITEKKKSELALAKSEERYSSLLQYLETGIVVHAPDTSIIMSNPKASELLGLSIDQMLGRLAIDPAWRFIDSDYNELASEEFPVYRIINSKGASLNQILGVIKSNNHEIVWLMVNGFPILNDKNEIIEIIVSFNDITERLYAENALKNSEEKYRRITDNINDVVWTSDLNLNINYVSPSVNRMLGLTEAEHIARPNKEKFPEKDFLQLRKILAEELENELDPNSDKNRSQSVELQYYKGDGTLIWVAIKVSFVRDREGKAIGLQGMTTDITVKKNAEIALAKSEERYRLISSVVSDYIFTTTLNENNELELSWVAGAFENITGYSFDEYKKVDGWRNSIHPDDLAKDDEDMAVLNQNKKVVTDLRTYKKNGDLVWVRVYAHPIWDESRNMLIGIYGGVKDITNSIIAENALKNSEEKFRKAFLTSSESITITSIETGVYKDVNNGFLQMLGYERNEAVGHSAIELNIWYDTKDRDFLVRNIKEHGILENYVAKFRTKKGNIIYGMLSANIIELDGENYILIITRDITKIKKVEHALQETNERLNLILESSPIAIWDWDIENDVWYATPKYYSMLGYDPDNGLPDRDVWLNRVHPDDRIMVAEKIEKVLNHNSDNYKYDARMLHADGTYRWQTVIGQVIDVDAENNANRMIGVRIDVHERKQAEEDLFEAKERAEKSEIFLHCIINNMGDPVFVKDDQSRLLLVNDAFCEVFAVEKESVMFKTLAENVAAEESESFLKTDKEVIETGIESISEETLTVEGFETRIISTKKTRFIDHNNIKYLVGIIRDMTDYKKVEDNLRRSEQLLQTVLDNFPGIIIWKDIESRYLGANLQFAKSAGFNSVDELIGLNDYDLPWSKTEAEKYRADDAFVIENNVSLLHMVENQHGADGSVFWLDTSKKPLTNYDGETIGVICVYTDITDKKEAEDALRESEAKLSALFSSMTEMVVLHELILDKNNKAIDYKLIECNDSFSNITGISKAKVLGKLATEVYRVDKAPYLDEYANVCITGESLVFRTYYKPLDKHFIISAVRLSNNQFATITADITVIQKSQEAIADKNKELENYLYVASHDLRSPLVNIQGFSQRLQKQTNAINKLLSLNNSADDIQSQIDKIINEDVPKSVNFILSNIIKMETLISGLLQLSRTGRIAISITEIDMNSLIKTILESYDFELTELKAQVDLTPLENCYGDLNQLTQLFSNIIGNAIKYRNKNRNLNLEISSETHFNKVVYAIKDNGVGIREKQLSKIWDIFYRVDPMAEEQGEGIGLSLARKIVDKHQGKIWAESTEGEGSTFYIELQKLNFK